MSNTNTPNANADDVTKAQNFLSMLDERQQRILSSLIGAVAERNAEAFLLTFAGLDAPEQAAFGTFFQSFRVVLNDPRVVDAVDTSQRPA
jgi:hypothetical protein